MARNRAGDSSDEQALDQVLGRSPGAGLDWRLAKLCQVCGELAAVKSWEEWCAAHLEGGEFKGFQDRHERCSAVPPGALAARDYRFCEICRVAVGHVAERRLGLSWVCAPCEHRVRQAGHDPALALDELARVRFAAGDRAQADTPAADLDWSQWPQGPRVAPPPGWLPPGLYRCRDCSEVRGEAWAPARGGELRRAQSTCLCEGIACRRCKVRRIRRPISDYYKLADGGFWHVPYFVGMFPCSECRAQDGVR